MFCDKCGNKMEVKKSKILPILISVICVLVIAVVVLVILLLTKNTSATNCANGDNQMANNPTEETTTKSNSFTPESIAVDINTENIKAIPEEDDSRTKNIEFVKAFYHKKNDSKYSDFEAIFNNKNNEMVDVDVYINFYKGAQRIGSEQGHAGLVRANSKFVSSISVDFSEQYDSVDISYKAVKSKSAYKELPIDSSKYIIDKKDKTIELNYKDIEVGATYYAYIIYKKNGNAIYATSTISSDLKEGETAKLKFVIGSLYELDFDDYEVGIYSAYKAVDY